MNKNITNNTENDKINEFITSSLREDMEVSAEFSQRLECSIDSWEKEENKQSKQSTTTIRRNLIVWITSAAAIITILFSVNNMTSNSFPSTMKSPQEAQLVLNKSFNTLGFYLSKGSQEVNIADNKISSVENKINQIINK